MRPEGLRCGCGCGGTSVASYRWWMGFLRREPFFIYSGLKTSSAWTLGYSQFPQFLFFTSFSNSSFRLCALISAFQPVLMHRHGLPSIVRNYLLVWNCGLIVLPSFISFSTLVCLYFIVFCIHYVGPYHATASIVVVFFPFHSLSRYLCVYTDQILPTHTYQIPVITSSSIPLGDWAQTRTLKLELWPAHNAD